MNQSRKSAILAVIGLAALAWIKLEPNRSVSTTTAAAATENECNARDPRSRCASIELGYPLGYGLVFTPIMDDFL